jgi:MFS family permease
LPAAPRPSTLAAFRLPGYAALWLTGAFWAFGSSIGVVAIGWVTLEVSNSTVAVGAVFAARLLPSLLLGIPLGNLVDRLDRRTTLVAVNLVGGLPLVVVAVLADAGRAGFAELLALSLVLGVIEVLRGTATQSYTFDLAGATGATNAIALGNLGGFLLGIAGSVVGGIAVERFGAGGAFLLAAGATFAAGASLVLLGRRVARTPSVPRVAPTLRQSLTLIVRNRPVALIALMVVVAEVLGFSAAILFPTFARDVLQSDAAGLGALTGARYVGGVAALLFLARFTLDGRGGRALLIATLGIGVGLVGFALSRSFPLSLLLIAVVGAACAGLDAIVQSLLQRTVHDSERGSAMGVWYFAVGFGPVGQLGLGAAAAAVGAPIALAASGGTLALIVVGLARVRAMRQLD